MANAAPPVTRTRRYPEVVLAVFGIYSVILGLFMLFAPGAFFDTIVVTTVLLAIALRISMSDNKVGEP
ncbi:hypothetical protein [Mycolicibacterium lutetiense]